MALYYATLDDQIEAAKIREISYRNLHTSAYIEASDNTNIRIPYMSITNKYKDYLANILVDFPMPEIERAKYKYKPKMLSQDLYGTTELWYALLEINDLYSTIDFTLDGPIKVYDPHKILSLLNEIMILEGIVK